jgi:hypothetical protein
MIESKNGMSQEGGKYHFQKGGGNKYHFQSDKMQLHF